LKNGQIVHLNGGGILIIKFFDRKDLDFRVQTAANQQK